jgi:hypothetical protein
MKLAMKLLLPAVAALIALGCGSGDASTGPTALGYDLSPSPTPVDVVESENVDTNSEELTAGDGTKILTTTNTKWGVVLKASGVDAHGVKHVMRSNVREYDFHRLASNRTWHRRDYFEALTAFYTGGKRELTVSTIVSPLSGILAMRAQKPDGTMSYCEIDGRFVTSEHLVRIRQFTRFFNGEATPFATTIWHEGSKTPPVACQLPTNISNGPTASAASDYFAPVLNAFRAKSVAATTATITADPVHALLLAMQTIEAHKMAAKGDGRPPLTNGEKAEIRALAAGLGAALGVLTGGLVIGTMAGPGAPVAWAVVGVAAVAAFAGAYVGVLGGYIVGEALDNNWPPVPNDPPRTIDTNNPYDPPSEPAPPDPPKPPAGDSTPVEQTNPVPAQDGCPECIADGQTDPVGDQGPVLTSDNGEVGSWGETGEADGANDGWGADCTADTQNGLIYRPGPVSLMCH